jgi:uncharacterized protein
MEDKFLDRLREQARKRLPQFGAHGFEHTERVYLASQFLGGLTGCDPSILLPAALLHDVGRGAVDHAKAGAELAKDILRSLGYNKEKIDAVTDAISTHSFTGARTPSFLEAKVLSDADKLDAVGATGVYRAAMYSVEEGRPLEDFVAHFHEKLLKLKETFHTEEAGQLAESRHRFMLDFLVQLSKEQKFRA